jgi:hypothetical protein
LTCPLSRNQETPHPSSPRSVADGNLKGRHTEQRVGLSSR